MPVFPAGFFRVGGVTAAVPASGSSPAIPVQGETIVFSDANNHGIPLFQDPTFKQKGNAGDIDVPVMKFRPIVHSADATTYSHNGETGWLGGAFDGIQVFEGGLYSVRCLLKWTGSGGSGVDQLVSRLYVNGALGFGTAANPVYFVAAEARSVLGSQKGTPNGGNPTTVNQAYSTCMYNVVVALAAGDQLIFEMCTGNAEVTSSAPLGAPVNTDTYDIYGADNLSEYGVGSSVLVQKINSSYG